MNTIRPRQLPPSVLLFLCAGWLALVTGCNRTQTPAPAAESRSVSSSKRHQLKGTVLSIDKKGATITVNGEEIPGFMSAMTMPYKVKNPSEIDPLSPGDSITADIVSQGDDYWLENLKVTAHPAPTAGKPVSRLRVPSPGEPGRGFPLVGT